MLRLENISKDYGNARGIKNITFQVKKGEICALLGHNGCGKTTTFRILLGLLKEDAGTLWYEGKKLNRKDYCLFGYMPEERSLLRGLTVEEHIRYLARLKTMKNPEISLYMDYWLRFFHVEKYRKTKIIELSKGNQQKVQLICALIHNPKIIIFDEPLNGLDVENVSLFKKLLQKLKEENKIVFVSSHQFQNIEHFCDYVVYLKEGEIKLKGKILELKKECKKRIVTIQTQETMFENQKGILYSYKENDYQVFEVENKQIGLQLLKQLKDVDECKMEYVSLSEVIKERIG